VDNINITGDIAVCKIIVSIKKIRICVEFFRKTSELID